MTLEAHDLARLERFSTEHLRHEVVSREEGRVWLAAGDHARLGL